MSLLRGSHVEELLTDAGVTPQGLNEAVNKRRKGRTADSATAEGQFDALNKYARDLTEAARDGKLDPVSPARSFRWRRTARELASDGTVFTCGVHQ